MCAWGFQAFENDDALDWLEELKPAAPRSSAKV
ncbi:uncharacterized protein DUF4259 [Arthrobacter sp. SLBN-100]|jgi:hypothetical protein|nr:uncharacterized protein DUF4259 [Arthrobacter sp. SLBN-100]